MRAKPNTSTSLILKERGLLDETLVIWAGEFGRTVYSQGKLTADDYGRDHHPRAFTIWMAGGGIKPGITLGETDDYVQHHSGSGARSRLECHHPAVSGDRSPAVDLQVPGTAVPPHRYGRPRRPEGPHLRRRSRRLISQGARHIRHRLLRLRQPANAQRPSAQQRTTHYLPARDSPLIACVLSCYQEDRRTTDPSTDTRSGPSTLTRRLS
jgi:hypothetical protein